MQVIVLMTFLALVPQNAQTLPSTTTVEGRVVVGGASRAPTSLSGVSVELRRVDTNAPKTYVAESSDDGRFRFTNIAPGQYRLLATREGYISAEYGQKQPNTAGLPFSVAAEAHLSQMDLSLTMTGAISGRVSWPNSQPEGIALVQALRPSYQDGKRVLTVVQSTRTDDLGNYRLFWLPPGRYFLAATPPNGPIDPTVTLNADATNASLSATREVRRSVLTRPVGAAMDDEIFVPIYFPGTAEEKNAVAIDVGGGGETRGMDIIAGFVRSYRVRGVIVDGETGEVVKNAQVRATTGNSSGIVTLDANTGAFSIGRLPTGSEYVLTATAAAKSGRFRISIRDHDFEIRVPIYSGFSVAGRVMVDGHQPKAEDVAGLRFTVQGDPPAIGGLQPTGSFAADGTFSFTVAPGDYFVNIAPILNRTGTIANDIPVGNIPGRILPVSTAFNVPAALKSVYVKSIRFGERDVLNDGLHLDGASSEPLEIQLSTHAATLEGIVTNEKGVSVPNAAVVLVPDAPLRQRPDLYKATRTDSTGHYAFDRIPAGSYRVFAWENILDGAWRDPDVIQKYESRGNAVAVEDNRKLEATLTVIDAFGQ